MATRIPESELTLEGVATPSPVTDTSVYVQDNDGNVVVVVRNPTGSAVVLTLVSTATSASHTVTGKTATIPASSTRVLKPLPPAVYNNDVGDAYLSCPTALEFYGLRF